MLLIADRPKATELLSLFLECLDKDDRTKSFPVVWASALAGLWIDLLVTEDAHLMLQMINTTKHWCALRELELGLFWYQTSSTKDPGVSHPAYQIPKSDKEMQHYLAPFMTGAETSVTKTPNKITIEHHDDPPYVQVWQRFPPVELSQADN